MKKILIMLAVSCTALLPIINLTNNSITTASHIYTAKTTTSMIKNDNALQQAKINKLNLAYKQRSINKNEALKANLVDSITLVNGKIVINYQNLNQKLFSKNTYKILKSPEYLKSLEEFYQMHQIAFNSNHHIIFADDIHLLKLSGVWFESHWYWWGYWILHLNSNRCQQLIKLIANAAKLAASSAVIQKVIVGLLKNWTTISLAIVLALFIIGIECTLLFYDHGAGVWFGIWTLIPTCAGSN